MRCGFLSVVLLIACGEGESSDPARFVEPEVLARATSNQHRNCLIYNAVQWQRFVECQGDRYANLVNVRGPGDPEALCAGRSQSTSPHAASGPVNFVPSSYAACISTWANASCAVLAGSGECALFNADL